MSVRIVVALVIACAWPLAAQGPAVPQNDSIRVADLKADLYFLASDAMRGRLTDTGENRIAAEFVKARFERLGLAPAVPGYFQAYDLAVTTRGTGNALRGVLPGEADAGPVGGRDWYVHRVSATGHATGPVVFAGFGMTAPDLEYDDYRDADAIGGKVVLAIDHEPGERDPDSPFDGVVTSDASTAWRKVYAAQQKGALAVLFVSDVHNHAGPANFENAARNAWPEQPPRIERYTLASWLNRITIPVAQVSPELAARLVSGTGQTLEALARASETARGATPVALPGAHIDLTTAVTRKAVPDRNVLAMIEGSDPQLKNEWVIVSAHVDHDGASGAQIFNGADDDGSGTVGLLEVAEAYALAAQAGQRPRRSVLFAAFNSEERGLLGAWAYAEQPSAPLAQTVAVLNLDMIGRNEEVPPAGGGRFNGLEPQTAESNNHATNVLGTVRSPDLKTLLDRANAGLGLELRYRYDNNVSQLLRRSDHWPFIQRGVPGLWILTGLHPDYHTANDRPERINYEKMATITRMVHRASWMLANEDRKPALLPRRPSADSPQRP